MRHAYYNENEPFAAQWLRNLITAGHIAAGEVDDRSIVDVQPDDLKGFAQCHFFAGIGGWAYALQLAGWPDDRPVWTGSCPCQPFSQAGARSGSEDERHLWPAWFRLIRECGPRLVIGEQVAGADGLAWLDHVCADLESADYAAAASDLPAAGVGAPHLRQRLYWMAYAGQTGRSVERAPWLHADWQSRDDAIGRGKGSGLGDTTSQGFQNGEVFCGGSREARISSPWEIFERAGGRRIEPGLKPLAHGIPGRVGRLRAYGNAIVPQVAAEFIRAVMDCVP
jgi:DNA (cytosine-5)-methyltransferase 1